MSDDADPIAQDFFGAPIRRSQLERMEAGWQAVLELRAAAKYRPLMDAGMSSGIGVNCSRCDHIGDFSDEGTRGYCAHLRHMVSTWHQCECQAFTAKTHDKGPDFIKKRVSEGEQERLAVITERMKA